MYVHTTTYYLQCQFYSFDYIESKGARTVRTLATELTIPDFIIYLRHFLFQHLNPNDLRDIMAIPHFELPCYDGPVSVFNSTSS